MASGADARAPASAAAEVEFPTGSPAAHPRFTLSLLHWRICFADPPMHFLSVCALVQVCAEYKNHPNFLLYEILHHREKVRIAPKPLSPAL